ncbi:response regulator [Panacagrimonas perspica]|uniref:response regulator n=1 Tax=Panacagrimonas perspica TaxID=381431 RepID=UPI0013C34ABD|nr:response regulator [Panacagrimonas perspica]
MSNADITTWERILQTETSPVCAFDLEYRLTAFNQAHSDGFFGIYAYRVKVGDVFPDLFRAEDQARVMRGFMTRALAGERFDVVQDFGDPDLSKPFWQISYTPLRDAAGKIVGAFHRAQDISARLRTEAELAAARQVIEQTNAVDRKLRRALRDLDDQLRDVADPTAIARVAGKAVGIALEVGSASFGTMRDDGETLEVADDWTAAGAPSLVGAHWLPHYGTPLDVLRRGDDVVFDDVDATGLHSLNAAACRAVGARSGVNVPVMEAGRFVAMFFVVAPLPRSWSRLELDFIRNVAERTRAHVERRRAESALREANASLERRIEQALAERESRFRFLAEALPIGILAATPDSRFDFANTWIQQELGFRLDDIQMASWSQILHPDDMEMVHQRWAEMASGGPPAQMEYRQRSRDGEYRWYQTRAVLMKDAQQRPVRIFAGVMDIEELIRARQTAEEATRAKSSFLSTMSHEIRTPMNAVIGMTSLLQDTPLSAEQHDFVRTIRSSGDHLLALINDILDFSRIESGTMTLERQPFSLRESLETAMDLVAPRASSKHLELLLQVEYGVPKRVVGDVGRLRQVLINLLANAIKFTESGEVALSVRADPRSDGHHDLQFSVRDTGIGIAPHHMERLFSAFSQADASIARRYGGSGLGLAICRRLVSMMDGRIWAESEAGCGSQFHFTVRLGVDAQADPAPDPAPTGLAGRRILVVDDNASHRAIIEGFLGRWGVEAVLSPSPRDALNRLWRGESFDLALLDYYMPEIDGAQLAASIHALTAYRTLPLILLSSMAPGDALGEFVTRLTKPVKPSQLFEAISDVLHHAQRQPRSGTVTSELPGHRRPLKLLVAEDNTTNQKVVGLLLRKLGYEADFVADGQEALLAVERRPYDAVLMDVQMPQMDGLQATREIRRRWGDAHRPRIVGLTANAMTEDRLMCLDAGMDDFLSKPVTLDKLDEALRRCEPRLE